MSVKVDQAVFEAAEQALGGVAIESLGRRGLLEGVGGPGGSVRCPPTGSPGPWWAWRWATRWPAGRGGSVVGAGR